jgi:signal transduction histidine kinase
MTAKVLSKDQREVRVTVPEESRARILIVDDDERNLLALTEVLGSLADVVTASSGRDALRALLRNDFAVILLDVFMPEMDGYETAGFIREREQTARIPIIFLSAVNKETEHLMRGYSMGAVDYVFKPVDPVVLRSKAAVFVDLYKLRREIEDRNRAEKALQEAKLRAEAQRLEMERELQATRLRQAAILNSLPVVLFEATYNDGDGLRRRVVGGDKRALNGGAADWLTDAEARWEDQIVPEDRGAVELEYAKSSGASDRASVRYRWATSDGTPLHLLEQAVRISDRDWVGSITDVTSQSLLENQLLQAQKLDALGQLTGGVAHDFNNLLAAVLGGIQLLRRRSTLDKSQLAVIEKMHQAVDQGVTLVKSLLTFARKQPLNPSRIDPHELCTSVVGLAEHALGHSCRLEWHTSVYDFDFYADHSQLTLVLLNLIINARDAMPDGGTIAVTIDSPADALVDTMRIAVTDEGTGIPPEILARVTEPFFTTKPPGKGTGLGLSMVAGFVQQSGGRLEIVSPEQGGTSVEIHLPSLKKASLAGNSPVRDASAARRQPLSVLLVEDDEVIRAVLAQIIEDLGLSVTVAINGIDALGHLRGASDRFDLVLTDISMPRMDGIELANAINEEAIAVPIAMMTGNPDPEITSRLPEGTKVLAKPLRVEALESLFACI